MTVPGHSAAGGATASLVTRFALSFHDTFCCRPYLFTNVFVYCRTPRSPLRLSQAWFVLGRAAEPANALRMSTSGLVCFESVSSLCPYIISPPRTTFYNSFYGSSQLPPSSLSEGGGGTAALQPGERGMCVHIHMLAMEL